MSLGAAELFEAGEVRGTHGLRGELRVRPLSGAGSALFDAPRVLLSRPGAAPVEYEVLRAAPTRDQVLLRLRGITDIGQAETLIGSKVLMHFADLPELPEDEFYWFELQGMSVVDRQRGDLGRIEDLYNSPAHDIYVVRGPRGEVLIPAVDEIVLSIERATRRMTVDLPEGLLPETDDL